MKGVQYMMLHMNRKEKGEQGDYFTSLKRCLECGATYDYKKPHRCGFGKWPCCKEVANIAEHKCYIQPYVPTKKKISR